MNRFNRFPLFALIILLAASAGCSSSKNFHLAEQYEESKEEGPVTIMPVRQEHFPDFVQHAFGYLNESQEMAFRQALQADYSRHAGVSARTIEGDDLNREDFRVQSLEVNNQTIEVVTPAEGAQLNLGSSNPGFLLLLDQYRYRKEGEMVDKASYAGHEQETKYTLRFETKYVYWNTRTGSLAGWGIARAEKDLESENPTGEDYTELLSRVLRDIAENGPVRADPR